MTVVANFSAIKYECCDKACAVTPSQCRCSTRVGYFLLALVVVSDGGLFCSHLCWCCSLLVQIRENFCLRKFNVVGAIVQLSLIASTLVIVGCACILSFLLALSIPYIVAGAVIKSAFVHTAVFGPIRFFRREKTGSD